MPVLGRFEPRAVICQDNGLPSKEGLKGLLSLETSRSLILGSSFYCCFNFSFALQEYL